MESDPNDVANFRALMELTDRNLLRTTFDTPLIEVIAFDAESLGIVAVNETALKSLGLKQRLAVRLSLLQLVPSRDFTRIRQFLTKIRTRNQSQIVFRMQHIDLLGNPRLTRVVLRYHHSPKPTFVAICHNITRYHEARTAATKAKAILATALESLPDGFVLYDRDDRLVICNEQYKGIYKESACVMQAGTRFQDILQYGLDRGEYADAIGRESDWLHERLLAHQAAETTVEQKLSNGQWLRIVERQTPDGGRVGLRIDITQLKENEAKLERAARTDHLTGLLNRRGHSEKFDEIAQRLTANERIAVLHVDLDKFKSINDANGHDAGDFVLTHVAGLLRKAVGDQASVARVGGDEFIILLKTCLATDEIVACGKQIIAHISRPIAYLGQVNNLSASIGLAFYEPAMPDSTNAAMSAADIALREAKQLGRGQCRVFEERMRDGMMRMIRMAQDIRVGLCSGEFEPFFQPQLNSLTGEIIGFEALIRWRHPKLGLVPAFEFLPAAERAGLMGAIDEVVMDRSCAAIAEISTWGLGKTCISINMSMPQLRDPNIIDRLQSYLDRYGITPEWLKIELLESTLLDERSDIIVENVHRLIAHGFLVELDDFGTGHAAIATLRKFAVSRIKIDRSLVQNINSDGELQVITGAIIGLADRLGIKVLAEGVETLLEQGTLQSLGCSCVQGYLHARPMPISKLQDWMIAHRPFTGGATYPQMTGSGSTL